MSQSTPTAVTKRKVMGRMDAAPSESPSSSVTPNARPRIVRAQHGYSSPSFSNNVTPTASRPAPGTGRARVDMSAFASPSSAAASPAMSPSVAGRPVSASTAGPSTISARISAPSPTMRSTPTFHTRSGSTVGISASSYRLAEARLEGPIDPSSLRSPKVRASNGSVDLGRNSPAVASPSPRISASSQLSATAAIKSPVPRAEQSPFQKPSTPSTSARSTASAPNRSLLSPQRSQESLDRAATRPQNRSPSPKLPPASPSRTVPLYFPQTSPPKPHPYTRHSEPIVPGRQASIPATASPAVASTESTRRLSSTNGDGKPVGRQLLDALLPSESQASSSVNAAARFEPGSAMTIGRASFRPASASQRAAIPSSFMDLAMAAAPPRPNAEHRSSYASSTFSTNSAASQPLSPSSETPRSPSEVGEADEARVHRKLLDLEITNRSLLAINAALEVTKLKQAREIRQLKKRLRDGKGLPVAAASRSSAGSAVFSDEDDLTDSDDDNDDLLVKEDPELEAAHQRCKLLVDHMVEQARKAILAEHDEPEPTGGKVLHPAELEELQREMEEDANNTEADTTAATDVLESSVTFDSSVADSSQGEHLPSSSSQFSELSELSGMDSSLASLSLQSIDVVFSGNSDSNATSRDGSVSHMPYHGNLPTYPDVSID